MSIVHIKIPELVVEGKPLGRHIHIDSRSLEHPAETAVTLRSVIHPSKGLPIDQGQVGSCTGNALVGALNTSPHRKVGDPVLGERDALKVYSAEEVLQGDGPYPPNDQGGSGTEVCQAAKNLGWLSSYQHATGIKEALLALVLRPVIAGVNWFTSMDTPNPAGLVRIARGATVRGGHELCADSLHVPVGATIDDLEDILIGLWQSWGPSYGLGGRFYWTAATWNELLAQGGDVTIPRTAPGWVPRPV